MSKNALQDVETYEEEIDQPEVLHIELFDRRPSGFIRDLNGVEAASKGTEHYHELDAPLATFIPTSGFRRGYKDEINRQGKKVKTAYNEPIRYIKEQMEISVERQKALGIEPMRASKENMIEMKRGEMTVTREGSHIGLYDYLMDSFYNADNPDRSPGATKIFRVVKLGQEEEKINEYDIAMADALIFVAKFYKKGTKGYVYQEDKINALCNLFEIYADTNSGKVTALNGLAKANPEEFMRRAEKFEQSNFSIIANALLLNVIRFEGNTAVYVEKEKVCADLGSETMTNQAKIERLGQLMQTADFAGIWQELQFEVELAQENKLNA